MGRGETGIVVDHATIGGLGLQRALQGKKGRPQVDARLGVSGLQFDGAAESFEGTLGVGGGKQRAAEGVVPLGVPWRQRNSAPPGGQRLFQRPLLAQGCPQVGLGHGETGGRGNRFTIGADGSVQVAVAAQHVAQVVEGLGIAGRQCDGAAVGFGRLVEALLQLQRQA